MARSIYGVDNIDGVQRGLFDRAHNGEYREIYVYELGSISLAPRSLLRVFADEPDVGQVPSTLYGTYFNESLSNWECVNLVYKKYGGFITFAIDHNITSDDLMI